ncbi:MAG: DUF3592 domain-containing protein [Methylocystis sp.]
MARSPRFFCEQGIFVALCIGVAAALLGTTTYTKLREQTLSLRGVTVEGRVIGVIDQSRRRPNFQSISFEFKTPAGEVVRSWDNVAQSYVDQLSRGSRVSIVYDPQDPSHSSVRYPRMEETFIPHRSFQFSGGIAAGLLALCGFFIFLSQRQYSQEKQLLEHGAAVPAIITNIRRHSFLGQTWVTIKCRLREEGAHQLQREGSISATSAEALDKAIQSILSNPTAVIDSTNRKRCILYPAEFSKATVSPST